MEAAIALILVSIIDIPSIISIIGGIKLRNPLQVGLVAFIAAVFGEALMASFSVTYLGPEFFPYKLIAQFLVAFTTYGLTEKMRTKKEAKGRRVRMPKEKAIGTEEHYEKNELNKEDSSPCPPSWKDMGQAAHDSVHIIEKAAHDSIPSLVRFLAASWNILMKGLIATGLMPLFRRNPWLHAVLIFLLMAFAPYLGMLFFASALVAMKYGTKADNNFIVSLHKPKPERFMGAQSDEEEREFYQAEAMLRVYESGHSMEEAKIVHDAIGELYDRKKARGENGTDEDSKA